VFLGNFQGPNWNYENHPNNSQFPAYENGQNSQSVVYNPSLADIMNSSGNGNQQHGLAFDYNNTQYDYPNQYRQ